MFLQDLSGFLHLEHLRLLWMDVVWCVWELTDGGDELLKAVEGKQRLWKLSEEKLQRSGDHMDLLPLSVIQVQMFFCRDIKPQSEGRSSMLGRKLCAEASIGL